MDMKFFLVLILVFVLAQTAIAVTETCDWEGAYTIMGYYGTGDPAVFATIATDPVHGGSQSLCLEDNSPSGTPQAFVAWITGLSDGDVVDGSFWRYDTTPGTAPSCRIYAHWNDDSGDISGYNGSAGGSSDYGSGEGWDLNSHSWTVEGGHTGLVIEARIYSSAGDIVWIDDMTITAPDGTSIMTPGNITSLKRNTWADIKATF